MHAVLHDRTAPSQSVLRGIHRVAWLEGVDFNDIVFTEMQVVAISACRRFGLQHSHWESSQMAVDREKRKMCALLDECFKGTWVLLNQPTLKFYTFILWQQREGMMLLVAEGMCCTCY